MREKIEIKFVGIDGWGRRVYTTQRGSLVVDINTGSLKEGQEMDLHAKSNNEFEGEPDYRLRRNRFEVVSEFNLPDDGSKD